MNQRSATLSITEHKPTSGPAQLPVSPSYAKRTTAAYQIRSFPKILKTYCSPIEILVIYMGIQ